MNQLEPQVNPMRLPTAIFWARRLAVGGIIGFRLLMGIMWFSSGITWTLQDRADPRLTEAIEVSLDHDNPPAPYQTFLRNVVIAHPVAFSRLVAFGELGTGLALLLGLPFRVGAAGAIFLLMNYGLAFSSLFPPSGNFILLLLHLPLLTAWPYRRLAVGDRLLRLVTKLKQASSRQASS